MKYRIKVSYVTSEGVVLFDIQERKWLFWFNLNAYQLEFSQAQNALSALADFDDMLSK